MRANLREVLEAVSLADVASDRLPGRVRKLSEPAEAWDPHWAARHAILPCVTADQSQAAGEPLGASLHPAEHRAYRELYASCRQLLNRWGRLSAALEGTGTAAVLEEAAERVAELLEALPEATGRYGLSGWPAAEGVGAWLADLRGGLLDRTVDTGMVMRMAVLDIEHTATLLAHLAELARARGDDELEAFDRGWRKRIRPEVRAVRRAAIELGRDPERAGAPLDDSALGQAVHRAGWVAGTVGEWVDRQVSRHAGG